MRDDTRMNRPLLPFVVSSLILSLGCGDKNPIIDLFGELEVATASLPNAGRTLAYSATLEAT